MLQIRYLILITAPEQVASWRRALLLAGTTDDTVEHFRRMESSLRRLVGAAERAEPEADTGTPAPTAAGMEP
jgi:hypothetical protein